VRLCRVEVSGQRFLGMIEGELVTLLARPPWEDLHPLGGAMPLANVLLLPPCQPSKIVCVGLNYRAHAAEMGKELPSEPLIFLKAPNCAAATGWERRAPTLLAASRARGRAGLRDRARRQQCGAHRSAGPRARLHVPGRRHRPRHPAPRESLCSSQRFDTFCPVGPWLETELTDPQSLDLELRVNGQVRQRGSTSDMIFSVAEVIAFVSRIMTLLPGDLVTTGTPPGVGPLASGDVVEVEIGGIGILQHGVIA